MVFSIYRPIRRSITLTQPSAEAESRIADKLSLNLFSSGKLHIYRSILNTLTASPLLSVPPLPFNEIVADLTSKNVRRTLRRQRPDNEE